MLGNISTEIRFFSGTAVLELTICEKVGRRERLPVDENERVVLLEWTASAASDHDFIVSDHDLDVRGGVDVVGDSRLKSLMRGDDGE
jgi:hypothetical protein